MKKTQVLPPAPRHEEQILAEGDESYRTLEERCYGTKDKRGRWQLPSSGHSRVLACDRFTHIMSFTPAWNATRVPFKMKELRLGEVIRRATVRGGCGIRTQVYAPDRAHVAWDR